MVTRTLRHMKYVASLLCLASLLPALGQESNPVHTDEGTGSSPLLYSDGGGFLIDSPKGWIIDHEVGQRLGTCCVFYPKGATWENSQTVMYPSIVTKRPGQQTIKEFMESDLTEFRQHDPDMSYEDAEDLPLKHNRIAKIRKFYNVNHGATEAVAYIDEEKIIALVVLSSKTKDELKDAMPLLRSALETYVFMDVKVEGSSPKKKASPPRQKTSSRAR
jgi:hypothetical protein